MWLKLLIFLSSFYLLMCALLFFFQEYLIFFPETLPRDYKFKFNQKFEEINVKTKDQKILNGLLFQADTSKGLIFYLHGNAGSLRAWGEVAKTYTDLNYDVFILDYRGFGKSEGLIRSERQLYEDLQSAYDVMKLNYREDQIVILGYSVGAGLAAKIASSNSPRLLILQAPFFNMTDLMRYHYPIIPTFLLRYKFPTNEFSKACKMPIVIFHGKQDEVIYYNSSLKLKRSLKPNPTLITLDSQGHNGMTNNPEYKKEIEEVLRF